MNIVLAVSGIILMVLGGYALGAQVTSAMIAPSSAANGFSFVALGGIAVNALGFTSFIKGIHNYPIEQFLRWQ